MKKILFLCALSLLAFSACQEQPEVDPNPNPVGVRVKLVEAPAPVEFLANATAPVARTIAFECVEEKMSGAITVDLTPDPSLLPMGAEMLPAAAYNLSAESVVVDPATHTGEVTLSVAMTAALEPGVRYLLPLGVSTEAKNVTIFGSTIFVEVSVTLPPYEIQAKVASVEAVNVPSFSAAVERSFEVECTDDVLIQDINVDLAVDAAAVPDGATLLPEGAYTLPESVKITAAAGKASVAVSINPGYYVKPGVNYVLPIRISCDAANVTAVAEKSLVTVAVSTTKNLAAIPVGGTVVSCNEFFVMKDKYLITRSAASGDVLRYVYDPATNSFGESEVIGTGYTSANVRLFGPGPENTIHYVTAADNVWYAQTLPDDCSSLKAFDDASRKKMSTGCAIFLAQLFGVQTEGMCYINKSTGVVMFYGMKDDGKTLAGINTSSANDFNFWNANYLYRFIYKDDVYGIGAVPGTLYRHKWIPASHTYETTTRTVVGSNWAHTDFNRLHVTQFGDNLLIQKGNATLVMFQFDPDNYTWDATGTATAVAQ